MPFILKLTRDISAPQQTVWEAWADFGNIHKFHPGLDDSTMEEGPIEGVGATRTCYFKNGDKTIERITIFEPISKIGWTLLTAPHPVKTMDVLVELQTLAKDKTKVTFTTTSTFKMGPIGWLIYHLAAKRIMTKNLSDVLVGLDEFLQK